MTNTQLIISTALALGAVLILVCGIAAFASNLRLFFYIKEHRHERWTDLTSLDSMGPGMSNPFRWLPYVYNAEDTGDPRIAHYKSRIRLCLKGVLLGLAIAVAVGVMGALKAG